MQETRKCHGYIAQGRWWNSCCGHTSDHI